MSKQTHRHDGKTGGVRAKSDRNDVSSRSAPLSNVGNPKWEKMYDLLNTFGLTSQGKEDEEDGTLDSSSDYYSVPASTAENVLQDADYLVSVSAASRTRPSKNPSFLSYAAAAKTSSKR